MNYDGATRMIAPDGVHATQRTAAERPTDVGGATGAVSSLLAEHGYEAVVSPGGRMAFRRRRGNLPRCDARCPRRGTARRAGWDWVQRAVPHTPSSLPAVGVKPGALPCSRP